MDLGLKSYIASVRLEQVKFIRFSGARALISKLSNGLFEVQGLTRIDVWKTGVHRTQTHSFTQD